jgi:hypothetical protein
MENEIKSTIKGGVGSMCIWLVTTCLAPVALAQEPVPLPSGTELSLSELMLEPVPKRSDSEGLAT